MHWWTSQKWKQSRNSTAFEFKAWVGFINSADMTAATPLKKRPFIAGQKKITERAKGGRIFLCRRRNRWPIGGIGWRECPPTLVYSHISAGDYCRWSWCKTAVENIEDSQEAAIEELNAVMSATKMSLLVLRAGAHLYRRRLATWQKKPARWSVSLPRGKKAWWVKWLYPLRQMWAPGVNRSTRTKKGHSPKKWFWACYTSVMTALKSVKTQSGCGSRVMRNYNVAEGIASGVGISNERARTLLQMVNYHPRKATLMYELHLSVEKVDQIYSKHPLIVRQQQLVLFN